MKIKEIRTRVIQWKGKTVPLPPHFCTNAMDLLQLPQGSMQTYTFHEWLVTEIIADNGLVGIGNAACSRATLHDRAILDDVRVADIDVVLRERLRKDERPFEMEDDQQGVAGRRRRGGRNAGRLQ